MTLRRRAKRGARMTYAHLCLSTPDANCLCRLADIFLSFTATFGVEAFYLRCGCS